jgi:hypothetical protein
VGAGILVQVVKDKSKLRARVVSDGFEPDWNMRFPRDIRQENTLYVVDHVNTAPDGKSYIASGDIKRFVQRGCHVEQRETSGLGHLTFSPRCLASLDMTVLTWISSPKRPCPTRWGLFRALSFG